MNFLDLPTQNAPSLLCALGAWLRLLTRHSLFCFRISVYKAISTLDKWEGMDTKSISVYQRQILTNWAARKSKLRTNIETLRSGMYQ